MIVAACGGLNTPVAPWPDRTIVLTFDDGPDPHWTPDILAVLRKYRVPGTFFVVGSRRRHIRSRSAQSATPARNQVRRAEELAIKARAETLEQRLETRLAAIEAQLAGERLGERVVLAADGETMC